ncbi:MAG: hypothetical protein KC419_10910 [Anaerolineales bacterium]|nr:hypothetical protein [Anaerolineales bacterium]MCA9928982.1 hypothetical protein [Anaerolineales bacterium]
MLVIPISSQLYRVLKKWAESRRMVFITGLPGVGKSLLIQQLALIAGEAGRKVHLLQWITARKAFETAVNLTKYPEIDGVTDPSIRKAVGLWAREAVQQWHEQHPDPAHILIGELPLIGNRLIELAEPHGDAVEPLLRSDRVQFVIPVPSWEVREVIEQARARTLADPQHEQEKRDAAPNVLQALWEEVNGLARQIELTKANPKTPYNPYIYGGVYEALLHNRHAKSLLIDEVLRPAKSVYEFDVVVGELQADETAVSHFMQQVEHRYTHEALQTEVANWHRIVTANPKPVDRGPELSLPLPDALPGVVDATVLTAVQRQALQELMALPLDTIPSGMIPALNRALTTLQSDEVMPVTANVHKFDVYDSYFNVTRTENNSGTAFLVGLLQAYRNVLADFQNPPFTLTVVELPMLRIALETTLRQFGI